MGAMVRTLSIPQLALLQAASDFMLSGVRLTDALADRYPHVSVDEIEARIRSMQEQGFLERWSLTDAGVRQLLEIENA